MVDEVCDNLTVNKNSNMLGNLNVNGNVGVGTTSPSAKLDVYGDIRINGQTIWLRGGTDKNHGIGWYGQGILFGNANLDGPAVFGFSGGALGTTKNGQKIALNWDYNGNVGIGESFPQGILQQKLEVNGNVWVIGGVGIGIGDPRDISGNNKLLVDGNLHMNGNPIYLRQGFRDQFDVIQWKLPEDQIYIGGYNGVSLGYTGQGGTPVHTTALSVNAVGNVGIGTTSPSAKLNVDPHGKGGIVIGNPSTGSGGFTSLIMEISAASDGYSSLQSIRKSGSQWGDISLNPYAGNVGIGKTDPSAKLEVNGDIKAHDVFLVGGDCAEDFDIVEAESVQPGTVMVIDRDGALRPSHQAYDKRVAGVISGAGDLHPGITLDRQKERANRLPLALNGKVYCKVDAEYNPVEVGDLLTTSFTIGHAMKADDRDKAFGAVIGKALHELEDGRGLIPILVALQ